MNLIEAIKSGRPFRRPGRTWVRQSDHRDGFEFIEEERGHADIGHPSDILADDWEIQEKAVTITRSQFWEAAQQAMVEKGTERRLVMPHLGVEDLAHTSLGILARKLGLEP